LNILSIPQNNEEQIAAEINNKLVVISDLEQEMAKVRNQSAFLGN
jgi:hypothetical protein